MGIYLDGYIPAYEDMVDIATLPVDSGEIGFFDVDDGVNLREWQLSILDKNEKHRLMGEKYEGPLYDIGFVEGCNDGGKGLFAYVENGRIVALEIRFVEDLKREN